MYTVQWSGGIICTVQCVYYTVQCWWDNERSTGVDVRSCQRDARAPQDPPGPPSHHAFQQTWCNNYLGDHQLLLCSRTHLIVANSTMNLANRCRSLVLLCNLQKYGATCISCKVNHQVAPLAIVANFREELLPSSKLALVVWKAW